MDASLPSALQQAPVPAGVRALLARLQSDGHEAFLVGGCVRDLLRGGVPKDWDVATQALPPEVQRLFPRVVPTGIAHGTVTVLVPEGAVEVTTYRVERGYVDGRRPSEVEFRRDLIEDLARRDFTINAMAFDPIGGSLRDPFAGQEDLRLRVVRCVGAAAERFGEDGLRPLRAVRFATVLDFALDPETALAIPGALTVFEKVALERRRDELLKLLLAPAAPRGLGLLRETGLLALLLPELSAGGDAVREDRVGRSAPVLEVRLAALLADATDLEGALIRLRLPARVMETVRRLLSSRLSAEAAGWSDAQLRRWLVELGPERAEAGVSLASALAADPHGRIAARVREVLAARPPLAAAELALTGADVMRILGIGPSPAVGVATRTLLAAVLEDPALNTREALERILRNRT